MTTQTHEMPHTADTTVPKAITDAIQNAYLSRDIMLASGPGTPQWERDGRDWRRRHTELLAAIEAELGRSITAAKIETLRAAFLDGVAARYGIYGEPWKMVRGTLPGNDVRYWEERAALRYPWPPC